MSDSKIVLTIGNSQSNVSGLSIDQHKQLRDLMSYKIDDQAAYFSGGFKNQRRTLLDKRGNFPSGLLHLALEFLKTVPYKVYDTRRKPLSQSGMFNLKLDIT